MLIIATSESQLLPSQLVAHNIYQESDIFLYKMSVFFFITFKIFLNKKAQWASQPQPIYQLILEQLCGLGC